MLTHKGTVPLETQRLILRRFTPDDAQEMFANWASDEEVVRYLSWKAHSSPDNTRAFLEMAEKGYEKADNYQWALVLKETGTLIGSLAVVAVNEPIAEAEIGWVIGRSFWGRGLAPEALRQVIAFLFDEVGFNRIKAVHNSQNPKSGRALIKSGMRYEGMLRQAGLNSDGRTIDVCYYSILKSDTRRTDKLY